MIKTFWITYNTNLLIQKEMFGEKKIPHSKFEKYIFLFINICLIIRIIYLSWRAGNKNESVYKGQWCTHRKGQETFKIKMHWKKETPCTQFIMVFIMILYYLEYIHFKQHNKNNLFPCIFQTFCHIHEFWGAEEFPSKHWTLSLSQDSYKCIHTYRLVAL